MITTSSKIWFAVVGLVALSAMGVLTATVDAAPVRADANVIADATPTRTAPPSKPEISVAVPPITTAPFTIPTGEPQ